MAGLLQVCPLLSAVLFTSTVCLRVDTNVFLQTIKEVMLHLRSVCVCDVSVSSVAQKVTDLF